MVIMTEQQEAITQSPNHPGGRPTETVADLPVDWYIQVLNLYSEGASDVEIKALIYKWRGSFSNNLWDRWIKEEEQFWETIKTGRLLSEAWWHHKGRSSLSNKDFSYTGWYMNMKNRFGWKDRNDITTNDDSLSPILVKFIGQDEATDN